jgi:hypothetical protein
LFNNAITPQRKPPQQQQPLVDSQLQSQSQRAAHQAAQAKAHPLAGASLYILDYDDVINTFIAGTTTSTTTTAKEIVGSDHEVLQAIEALGGRIVNQN